MIRAGQVVRGENDDGLLVKPAIFQCLHNLPDAAIEFLDHVAVSAVL